jgi:hypothetical protein
MIVIMSRVVSGQLRMKRVELSLNMKTLRNPKLEYQEAVWHVNVILNSDSSNGGKPGSKDSVPKS